MTASEAVTKVGEMIKWYQNYEEIDVKFIKRRVFVRNQRRGTFVAINFPSIDILANKIFIGWSMCSKVDRFDKDMGDDIAIVRAMKLAKFYIQSEHNAICATNSDDSLYPGASFQREIPGSFKCGGYNSPFASILWNAGRYIRHGEVVYPSDQKVDLIGIIPVAASLLSEKDYAIALGLNEDSAEDDNRWISRELNDPCDVW
jgi:hypothetical protein